MRISKKHLVDFSFWGILSINLLYLNGLFSAYFKTAAFFSPIILVSCVLIIFNTPRPKYYSNLFIVLLAFYVLYMFIGLISIIAYTENLHPKTSLYKLFRGYVSSILIYWALYQYIAHEFFEKGKNRLIELIHKASFLLILPLFFTIFGSELGLTESMSFIKDYGDRQIGIFSNPNTTGLHANYVLCFCFYSIISNRKGKIFWLILIGASCYAAFLSLSKAAILMTLLNLTFFTIFNVIYFYKLKFSGRLISILNILLIAYSSIFIYTNFEKLTKGFSYASMKRIEDTLALARGEINDNTTSERSGLAELVLPKILDHPLTGNGFGSFHRIREHGLGVHNTAILIVGESGVLPGLIFVLFLFIYFRYALSYREIAYKYLFVSVMLTFLMIAFLTSHNALDERISNVLLGLIIPCIIFFKLK